MNKLHLVTLSVFLLWTPGFIKGNDVTQTDTLWKHEAEDATMQCNHTKGDLYYQMYWYRQLPGETMELIAFTSTAKQEHDFGKFDKDKFAATKTEAETGTFTVKRVEPKDEALYFCAVAYHSDTDTCGSSTKTPAHSSHNSNQHR
ncbi:hypothetical protein Q5P01_020865 [Channa striata]|uniref:Ig-like domain-containing protein n=1 Tax=Channa striata TaxID=64152 RepID=A0AA88LYH9_CHASR|nr:hypothetical protein Q5P01_020865 [Channa striata]